MISIRSFQKEKTYSEIASLAGIHKSVLSRFLRGQRAISEREYDIVKRYINLPKVYRMTYVRIINS